MLDAGAFYAGTPFLSSSHELFTTQAVFEEVKHIKSSLSALEVLKESGRLVVQEPEQEHVERVLEVAARTGDKGRLSPADISIISLALQLGTLLVTDDFSVANVAKVLGILVEPATAGKKIKQVRRWISYCSGCGRTFDSDKIECPLCGNKLSRKYRTLRPEP